MRVVLASFGSFGDLHPHLGLGLALKAQGHQPVLAVTRAYLPLVEAAGLEGRPIRPDGDPTDHALVSRVMDPMRGPEFVVRRLMMPQLREMYDDLVTVCRGADLVVSHPLTFAAPILCEQRGLPWAASVLAPLSFFSRRDPPLSIPSPMAAAVHRRWPAASGLFTGVGLSLTRSWTRAVQDLRQSVGLGRGANPVGPGQFSPHLNLALFSRVLAEPQPDWPPATVVTGAVRYDATLGGMSDDLTAFLENGPPPLVFTLGSSAVVTDKASHFYDVSAAVAGALGMRAVLLTGHLPENRPAVSSGHVFVTPWAPHSALFPRAAAIVHQGGAGTLNSALASGRPMLVVPFAHDQPDNAERVFRLGVARVVYPQQYTAARVRRELESLLGDPETIDRAVSVQAVVRAEDGAAEAARALSALARRSAGSA
ncbi:MAG TPA: glycosyltransferase [Vicinamibacterales bacterium]|nr:glycosyltransferase [Vicinamibacterales bacterium]